MLIINGILITGAGRGAPKLPWCRMEKSGRKGTRAGGFILAICLIAGAIVGGLLGQPSAGLLAGGSLGALIALALWWRDRRYSG
jgi:hypothetical protein